LAGAQHPEQAGGCWRLIGVFGDRRCPELARHVHCRNCLVYAKAAMEVLDQPLPRGYRQQWTEHYAQERKPRHFSSSSAVPFRVGSEWLALPTHCFQEVTERRPIHSIPRSHGMLLGLANIRGELLLCVSLGHLLGLVDTPPRNLVRVNYNRLLVVSWMDQRFGFPVNEIQGPYRFYVEDLNPPPAGLAKANAGFAASVLQWRDSRLVLLDPDRLFSALNRNLA